MHVEIEKGKVEAGAEPSRLSQGGRQSESMQRLPVKACPCSPESPGTQKGKGVPDTLCF
jgi:hypothetical protein